MKAIVLHGSAHVGGDTDTLAARFLEGLGPAETEHFRPSTMAIAHCRACGGCAATGACVIDDDMRAVYPALKAADVAVMAAPMFWGYMTSQLKTLFDRLEAVAGPAYFGGKRFVLLLAYRRYYGSMVEWSTRIATGFGSSLRWLAARTWDPGREEDVPVDGLPEILEEAAALGRATRADWAAKEVDPAR